MSGWAASSRSGRAYAIRPSCSSARTTPATRKRASLAAGGLHGERRPRPQPERVGQPDADLDLAGAAQPPALGERRRLEARVVAGVGDHPQRLAEPERVGHVGLVALGGVGDAGDRLDRVDLERVEPDRELVALADRAGVVAQPLEQRREREHQRDDARAHGDRRDRGGVAPARGEREARAGGEQAVTRGGGERRRRAAAAPAPRRGPGRRRAGSPPAGGAPRARPATSPRP